MTQNEMDKLDRGDIIVHVTGGSYIVLQRRGQHLTAIREIDVSNPTELEIVLRQSASENQGATMTTNQPTESWIFTFGFGHRHPATGERLANRYVKIDGDVNRTRDVMNHHFGNRWSMQYPSEEKAGVEKYRLKRIDLP